MLDRTGVAGLTSNSTVLMDEPLSGIRVNEVTVDVGTSRILTDVCVNTEQGSALSVLGPKWVLWKTTLLRVLAGLQKVTAGTVHLDGKCVLSPQADIPPEQRNVGLVFQDWALFPHLTVLENISFWTK